MNLLMRCFIDLEPLQKDITLQNKEITGLKTLRDACERDNKGDPVEVWQNVIESERQLLLKDVPRLKTQTIVDTIKASLGDIQLMQHQMKQTSSGNCVVCSQSMSMFSKGAACGGTLFHCIPTPPVSLSKLNPLFLNVSQPVTSSATPSVRRKFHPAAASISPTPRSSSPPPQTPALRRRLRRSKLPPQQRHPPMPGGRLPPQNPQSPAALPLCRPPATMWAR